jgi:hypothetical protein
MYIYIYIYIYMFSSAACKIMIGICMCMHAYIYTYICQVGHRQDLDVISRLLSAGDATKLAGSANTKLAGDANINIPASNMHEGGVRSDARRRVHAWMMDPHALADDQTHGAYPRVNVRRDLNVGKGTEENDGTRQGEPEYVGARGAGWGRSHVHVKSEERAEWHGWNGLYRQEGGDRHGFNGMYTQHRYTRLPRELADQVPGSADKQVNSVDRHVDIVHQQPEYVDVDILGVQVSDSVNERVDSAARHKDIVQEERLEYVRVQWRAKHVHENGVGRRVDDVDRQSQYVRRQKDSVHVHRQLVDSIDTQLERASKQEAASSRGKSIDNVMNDHSQLNGVLAHMHNQTGMQVVLTREKNGHDVRVLEGSVYSDIQERRNLVRGTQRHLLGDGMLNGSASWMNRQKYLEKREQNAEKNTMLDLINKVHVCMCVYMHVYVCVYTHTYIYTLTCIHTRKQKRCWICQ